MSVKEKSKALARRMIEVENQIAQLTRELETLNLEFDRLVAFESNDSNSSLFHAINSSVSSFGMPMSASITIGNSNYSSPYASITQSVKKFFEVNPDKEFTIGHITTFIPGAQADTIRTTVSRLKEENIVTNVERGRYRYTNNGIKY